MSESIQSSQGSVPLKARMKTWSFWKPFVLTFLGGTAGYAFYYFVGCTTGSCAITSNPYASIAIGAVFGYLLKS